jgi:arylsulfatase A-like enzyme
VSVNRSASQLLGLGFALVTAVGCTCEAPSVSPGADRGRPDVLLATIDTLRADYVGAYGAGRHITPQLDALAERGVLFETVYAPMGTTCPSHATLFTSRSPLSHGLTRNGLALPERERTLPEMVRAAGWQTAAFLSSYPLKRKFGFAQGFDYYDDDFDGSDATIHQKSWEGRRVQGSFDRRGGETVDALIDWLNARDDGRPVFVWLHLFDPHAPYLAPSSFRASFPPRAPGRAARDRAAYSAEVAYADAQLGRAIEAFERAAGSRPPLLVVTSDHGEGLWDHGWRVHNRHLYEEELRVPWIAVWEGHIPAGVRVAQPAHLIDLAPTLAGWLELDTRGMPFDGWDLGAAVTGGAKLEPNGRSGCSDPTTRADAGACARSAGALEYAPVAGS